MGEIDTDFMLNLERARDLLPKLKASLDVVADIPEDLDEPVSQQEVDALTIYSAGIHLLARRLLELAGKMMVGGKVQARLIQKEKEQYEPGTRDMYEETGHTRADF